jgi:hypothetical protein
MRKVVTAATVNRLLEHLGRIAREPVRLYLTGGATALLHGWRTSTIDVDLCFEPEQDAIFREIPAIKEALDLNIEFARPTDFIPEVPGWHERSLFIGQFGMVAAYHTDPFSQALSKIERGHDQDIKDVREMFQRGLVRPAEMLQLFGLIEPSLYRYPAVDPPAFRRAVEKACLEPGRSSRPPG